MKRRQRVWERARMWFRGSYDLGQRRRRRRTTARWVRQVSSHDLARSAGVAGRKAKFVAMCALTWCARHPNDRDPDEPAPQNAYYPDAGRRRHTRGRPRFLPDRHRRLADRPRCPPTSATKPNGMTRLGRISCP